ncbi:MAG: CDP-alcohol phosphatidyltransferase family protein [Chloroflexi bacterium]|nr:CDP-alcohol phosphatidyltransferase family protein [Chloroflexota bacterium]
MAHHRARILLTRYFSGPVARLLLALHVGPNAVTLLGLALSGAAAYLLANGHLLAGGAVTLAGGALDAVDGTLARLGGRASSFGAFLDSATDRLSEAAVLLGLLLWYAKETSATGVVLVYLALVLSFMVSYTRARAEGLGLRADVGVMDRALRLLVIALGLMLGFPEVALGIVAALSALTAAQRAVHVWRGTRGG